MVFTFWALVFRFFIFFVVFSIEQAYVCRYEERE